MEIYIFIVVVTFCLSDGLEGLRVPARATRGAQDAGTHNHSKHKVQEYKSLQNIAPSSKF